MHRISKVIYTWTHRSNWAHAGVWWGPPATCLEAFVQLYRRFQQAERSQKKDRGWLWCLGVQWVEGSSNKATRTTRTNK